MYGFTRGACSFGAATVAGPTRYESYLAPGVYLLRATDGQGRPVADRVLVE
ncbi:hypothetical protein [Hymenobacter chitinivorans]|uniref:hypothetical protein n=1 Tax=Hymenobacter chitinivorans TaxID=89969 RepID=UPI0012FD01D3|nr:hypothetical protein [Hymenobacter chitinivorans]